MAQVDIAPAPSSAEQYRALVQMRLLLLRRGLQSASSKVSFVLRIVVQLLFASVACLLGIGAGVGAYYAVSEGELRFAQHGLFFASLVWQLLVLLRSTVAHEVGRNLLRFPIRFKTYVTLWTLSGMLGFTNIAGAFIGIGVFIGAALAGAPYLAALATGALFFLFNFALSRVSYLWLERFMAHRRTREFLLIVFSLIGILPQLIRIYGASVLHYVPAPIRHAAVFTPPALLARTLMRDTPSGSRWLAIAINCGVIVVLIALVLYRLLQEFRGEDLHEASTGRREVARTRAQYTEGNERFERSVPFAVFMNEVNKLRHSGSAIYQTVAPLLFVVLFGFRMAQRMPSFLLPAGAMYLSLSIMGRATNSLGDDGAGAQLYTLAPVRFRDVMIGKNLFAVAMFLSQIFVLVAITFAVGTPKFWPALYALLFVIFSISVHLWVGNITSIRSAWKIDFSRMNLQSIRAQRRAGGARSSWRTLVAAFGTLGAGVGAGLPSILFDMPWLSVLIMFVLAAAASAIYITRLRRFDHITVAELEPALTALSKTA